MNAGTSGRLTVDSVHNIGPHYARTLREWKRKFLASWEDTIEAALVKQYSLGPVDLEIFKRKWICKLPLYSYLTHTDKDPRFSLADYL